MRMTAEGRRRTSVASVGDGERSRAVCSISSTSTPGVQFPRENDPSDGDDDRDERDVAGDQSDTNVLRGAACRIVRSANAANTKPVTTYLFSRSRIQLSSRWTSEDDGSATDPLSRPTSLPLAMGTESDSLPDGPARVGRCHPARDRRGVQRSATTRLAVTWDAGARSDELLGLGRRRRRSQTRSPDRRRRERPSA